MNFAEGAEIDYSYEATADFQATEDGANLMITTASAGTVTVTADRWYVFCFAYAYVYGSRSLSDGE